MPSDGDVSGSEQSRAYAINSDTLVSIFPVQHFYDSGSRPRRIKDLRRGGAFASGPSPGADDEVAKTAIDAWTEVAMRRMIGKGLAAAVIGAVLGRSGDNLSALALNLHLPVPAERVARLAGDGALVPGTLRTAPGCGRLYSPRQLYFLVHAWLGETPIAEIALALGRSASAVGRKLRALGFPLRHRKADLLEIREVAARHEAERAREALRRKRFKWSAHTEALCTRWREGWSPGQIAAELGTTATAVSTRATRACLPSRTRAADGRLQIPTSGFICLDPVRGEYFWSERRTATQSAYHMRQAAARCAHY